MKTQITFSLIIASILLTMTVYGQDRKMMERIEAKKVAFITDKLDLSVAESQTFWPIYNEYQNEVKSLKGNKDRNNRPDDISEDEAIQIIEQQLETELSEVNLKIAYIKKIQEVLPAVKVAKLLHIESEFRRRLLEVMGNRREKMKAKGRGMR